MRNFISDIRDQGTIIINIQKKGLKIIIGKEGHSLGSKNDLNKN